MPPVPRQVGPKNPVNLYASDRRLSTDLNRQHLRPKEMAIVV